MLNFSRLPICGHDWHVVDATHHSALSGYEDAIAPSTKPNEANADSDRERDDAGMSGWVQGRGALLPPCGPGASPSASAIRLNSTRPDPGIGAGANCPEIRG